MIALPVSSRCSFQELSPRERLTAIFDDGFHTEMAGPFDGILSPWLSQQGMVSQSDDGIVVSRGTIGGREAVGIAIEPRYEGGSIGEVGGAKIAVALKLARESSTAGRQVNVVLLLETGGVRLQEANLGLAAISEIHSAIIGLREFSPVIAVIAGPIGCFGGMSLGAALCSQIIATSYGRLGMNGAEVIEQEAGPQELDASDRDLVRQLVGCESRLRDRFIDSIADDDCASIRSAVVDALHSATRTPGRLSDSLEKLVELRRYAATKNRKLPLTHSVFSGRTSFVELPSYRSRLWLELLALGEVRSVFGTPSIIEAEVSLGDASADTAIAIAITPDPDSILPRAANGELGLEQAWTLAERLRDIVADDAAATIKRPILAVVDTPGQAFGKVEEEKCISVAAAAAVDAYAAARSAGHIVLTLVVGKAMSGSFLAHGMQSDHIVALESEGVSMHAMNPPSVARITRRTLEEVEAYSSTILPMSYEIQDAYRLGLIDALLSDVSAEAPDENDLSRVRGHLSQTLQRLRDRGAAPRELDDNLYRHATVAVQQTMRDQWYAFEANVSVSD
jgi:malonate decarboxylase beta subunit